MPIIIPFRALRPGKRYVEQVVAYPYDVLEETEARKIAERNPRSFLRVEKSEINLPPGVDPEDERIFTAARDNLQRLIKEKILFLEDKPCYYVYGQAKGGHTQFGIAGGVSIDDYEAGNIKRHELTRPDKERERVRNIEAANANTGLVFLVYRAEEAIDRLVEEIVREDPEYDFIFENGVRHRVWIVKGESKIEAIRQAFLEVRTLYIADGHHRAAAAAAVARGRRSNNPGHKGAEEYNYFLAVALPDNQVQIMDYNRIVKDLNGLTKEELISRIKRNFSVSADFKDKSPSRPHEIGMYLNGKWYRLNVRTEGLGSGDRLETLDVRLLQDYLLNPVLGIRDPRTDQRVKFIGGIRGVAELERLVDSGEAAIAFSLYPPSVKDLMEIADSGRMMPPKSTWFEPKLLSGLLIHLLG